jgi:hypothetical protein
MYDYSSAAEVSELFMQWVCAFEQPAAHGVRILATVLLPCRQPATNFS